jgi:hypothetical protein
MKLLFAALLILTGTSTWAQDSRWIDLEWEAVTDAREYQIELFQEDNGKAIPRGKYKTDTPEWSHAVSPGRYFLRLRSTDKRGVPGEWSENILLKVRMQNPLLLRPVPSDKISESLINFEWGPIVGAAQYQLIVRNKNREVIHNAITPELKSSVYIEKLGDFQWTTFALEKDEAPRNPADLSDSLFKNFTKVGGLLEAPKVRLTVNEKVILSWDKVRSAEAYEIDYFPAPDSGEKNRRFKLRLSPLAFSTSKLKEGVSTLTIKSVATGQQDSNKSIVKIAKSGSQVEVEDIIQGKEEEIIKTVPTQTFFKDEVFVGVTVAQYGYESDNAKTDTHLSQKSLTGLGFTGEWNRRPTLNALNRKLEMSFLHLSSGVDSGYATRAAYTYHKEKKWKNRKFTYGAGLSYLSLPSFMGNRLTDKVEVGSTSTIGPDLQVGFINPLSANWDLQSTLILAYHPIFLSSSADGAKPSPWMKAQVRAHRYYTDRQAFFAQIDYQAWTQEWSQQKSTVAGLSFSFGVKTSF